MSDPAGLPALQEAIRHLHGLDAKWIESVAVHETHEGKTVWQGEVQVFEVTHPKTSRCYASPVPEPLSKSPEPSADGPLLAPCELKAP